MPFTPSHAIVALPFIRTPLVPGALAIGAMAPDLPLFLPTALRQLLPYGVFHDPTAILATVALALVLLLGWRLVLRPATRSLLPDGIARRVPASWDLGAGATLRETFGVRGTHVRTVLLLLISLALGVLSHIAWDSFTHEGRAGTSLLPALEQQWGPLLGYKWLQYGSGIGGLVTLAGWALLRLRRATPTPVGRRAPAWLGVALVVALAVGLVGAALLGYLAWGPFTDDFTLQHLAYRTLPQTCGVWGVLVLLTCVVIASRPAPQSAITHPIQGE